MKLSDWIKDEKGSIELLPVCHTTKWKNFEQIIEKGVLSSRYSRFLPLHTEDKEAKGRIYLFYGLPFYIYETGVGEEIQIEATDQLPIAIIFNPKSILALDCFYPFDTGALSTGKFAKIIKNESQQELDVYKVSISDGVELQKTIERYYHQNENYCFGKLKFNIESSCHPSEENLIRLFEQSVSTQVDIRSRAIEVHCTTDLVLSDSIMAVVLPRLRSSRYSYIIDKIRDKFPAVEIIYYNDLMRFNHESIRTAVLDKTMDFYDNEESMNFAYSKL